MPWSIRPLLFNNGKGAVARRVWLWKDFVFGLGGSQRIDWRAKQDHYTFRGSWRIPTCPAHCLLCPLGMAKVASNRSLRKACQHAQTSVQKIAAVLPGPGAAVAGDLPASLLSHFKAGISLCCAGEASSASINLWDWQWHLMCMVTAVCVRLRDAHVLFKIKRIPRPFSHPSCLWWDKGFEKSLEGLGCCWFGRRAIGQIFCAWDYFWEQVAEKKKRQRYGQHGLHCVQIDIKPGSPRCGQWGLAQNSLLSTPGCDSQFMADKIRGEGMFCDSCSKLHPLCILLQNSWRLYVIRKGLADSSVHRSCWCRSRDASASPFTIYDVPRTEESSAVSSPSPTTALPIVY